MRIQRAPCVCRAPSFYPVRTNLTVSDERLHPSPSYAARQEEVQGYSHWLVFDDFDMPRRPRLESCCHRPTRSLHTARRSSCPAPPLPPLLAHSLQEGQADVAPEAEGTRAPRHCLTSDEAAQRLTAAMCLRRTRGTRARASARCPPSWVLRRIFGYFDEIFGYFDGRLRVLRRASLGTSTRFFFKGARARAGGFGPCGRG